jgi:hypothetical protein
MDSHLTARVSTAWNTDATYHTPSEYHSDALMAIAAAFLALTITFTTLRFFVRGYMIRALGWDDWLILIALNSFVCQAAFLLHIVWMEQNHNLEMPVALSNALEVSEDYMKLLTYTDFVQYVILEFGFYLLTSLALKLSLAVFFLRIVSSSAHTLL